MSESSNEHLVRIAIISTPRSGSTWMRHLLMKVYQAQGFAVHNPADLDWDNLPERAVFQLHWHRTHWLREQLRKHHFRILVLSRHPLDVLISILHFCLRDPTARWLEGESGNERGIYGAMPTSTAFMDYATGSRAGALLSVTPEWCAAGDTLPLRYEDLVHNPRVNLQRLIDELSWPVRMTIAQGVTETSIPKLRAATNNDNHFWIGRPGLWRKFLPVVRADCIESAHVETFRALNYACDADPTLDDRAADANWIETVWAGLAQAWQSMLDQKEELERTQAELAALREQKEGLPGYGVPVSLKQAPAPQSQEGDEVSFPTSTIVPLPPRELRARATGTGNAQWFQKSGRMSVAALESAIVSLGVKWSDFGRILDFGAGCGRLLRHLLPRVPLARVWACDTDSAAMAWLERQMPRVHARRTDHEGPLPFTSALFDLVVAVDVFTTFDETSQDRWLQELMRVTRPGGLFLVTTNGLKNWTDAVAAEPELKKHEVALTTTGFCATSAFEGRPCSFHHPAYIRERWARWLDILDIRQQAVYPAQDLVILLRRAEEQVVTAA
jgi:SAM-dependent methyltransferase